ncbi:NnrU family protein [Qipengyuania sp.]|uniref:NnrU family protein n=1 Tax=Qipengyuania sp. TaxID=2004515 RepID=UPI0035C79BD2
MDPLVSLIAASIAFVGTHFALSHPLREPLVTALGDKGFMLLYTLVALATFYWMVSAFGQSPAGDLGGATGEIGWILASVLTLPALVLFIGSLWKNPALPAPGAEVAASARPVTGVFAVTRHPMMWGFALWAIAHIVLWWDWRTVILASAILFLALVGAHMQDRKKRVLMGDAWAKWQARTNYWPRWGKLPGAGLVLWALAIVLWLVLTYGHIQAAGIPAGIWRWV